MPATEKRKQFELRALGLRDFAGVRNEQALDPFALARFARLLVASYDQPYWPNSLGSLRDNARLGPLPNDAGLWLTATSYHRSQKKYPTP